MELDLNELRAEMRAAYESVMILDATARIAHEAAIADHSKKAESLAIITECQREVKILRTRHRVLKEQYDLLQRRNS